jgi:hypothetical protein
VHSGLKTQCINDDAYMPGVLPERGCVVSGVCVANKGIRTVQKCIAVSD